MMRVRYLAFGVIAAVCLSGPSYASINIFNANGFFFPGTDESSLKIVNFENLVKGINPDDGSQNTGLNIEEGDRFRGIFRITTSYNEDASIDTNPTGFELTGIFETMVIRVESVSATSGLFELAPYAGFASDNGLPDGAMIAFYQDFSPDFSAAGSVAAAEAKAKDGSLYMALGAPGAGAVWGTDYYWAAQGDLAPASATFAASLALLVNNTAFPDALFADITQAPPTHTLGAFTNETNLPLIKNEFALKGSTQPNGNPAVYAIRSDDPLRAKVLPEPTAIVTWMLLIGAGGPLAMTRRSQRVG